jgi:predicted permease
MILLINPESTADEIEDRFALSSFGPAEPANFAAMEGRCNDEQPAFATSAAEKIGAVAGGVALFVLGLTPSGIPIPFNGNITFNVLAKNVIQPLIMFVAAWALGLKGELIAQTFLMGVLPTATEASAIAVSRNIYRDEAAGSTIASVDERDHHQYRVAVAFMVQS